MTAGDFAAVWSLLAVNVLSPGPNVLTTIACAMDGGRRAGMAAAAGVAAGVAVWAAAMTAGAAAVFARWPETQRVLTAVAVCLLLWFAAGYLRAAWAGWRQGGPAVPSGGAVALRAAFRRSLAVNATNPKALTSWLAILALVPATAGAADRAVIAAGAAAVAGAIHVGYAFAFSTPAAARAFLRAAPAVRAGAGCFFLSVAAGLARTLLP